MDRLIGWLAPILSTIIITAATASINAHLQRSQKLADERHAETEAKRKTEAEWRERMEEAITDLKREVTKSKDAQQSTMRQSLIHSYEKYVTRGWLTTEELSAWLDMHDKYSAMGFNGLIDTYREHIVQLEIRPLDELAKCD